MVPLGPGGGQQHIDGAAHRDHIEKYVVAHQMVGLGVHHAAPVLDGRAQRFKALQMLVDGAGADIAAAGIGHLGPAPAAQQRAQQVIAGPQAAGLPVGNVIFLHVRGVDRHPLAGTVVHLRAQPPQNVHQRPHVLDIRQVFDGAGLVAQKRRRNHRHRRILTAADGDLPHQRVAAGDQHFILAFHNAGPCGPPSPLFAVWRFLRHCIQKVSAFIIHDLRFLGKLGADGNGSGARSTAENAAKGSFRHFFNASPCPVPLLFWQRWCIMSLFQIRKGDIAR